ncbi:MAG: helicase-exonuclease AddAB subunit AddA [Clostridia bacterium]|nr:helicase-exonuclease AddAB subunit AddA [Clostridia bacterium]
MAERKWTPEQKNAIEADSGTVLVSAAAGSGKTSVLVERIVRKITSSENAVPPETLLVVTFTNAAAAEMRSRIFSRVTAKISEDPKKKSEYILLLSKLSEMQVCTMDSFCMNLVKQNSHALGIDADFRMLESGEEDSLKYRAASAVCERRFNENPDTFLPLARMFEAGKNDANLIKTVIRLSDYSMSEPDPEKWLLGVAGNFISCDAEESVWGKCIIENILFAFKYCFTLLYGAFCDIGEDEELEAKLIDFFNNDKMILDRAFSSFNTSDWNGKYRAIEKAVADFAATRFPSLKKPYSENPSKCAAKVKRDEYKAVTAKMLELMCCTNEENSEDAEILSGVANELVLSVIEYNKELLAIKKEMSAYSFSDISHFALSLLTDSNSPDGKTPLARELSQFYSEILIDEYQDTNRAQETLFLSVSKDGKNMFFVGDVKQSIYRFRLASPELFIEKCDRFPYYDGIADESKIILSQNFRSRKGILSAVNYVFSSLMSKSCGEIEYNEDEMLNFPESGTPTDTTDVYYDVIEAAGEKQEEAVEARYIVSIIKEKLTWAFVGEGEKRRKAEPSDFCILLRSKAKTAPFFVKELKNAGIPVSCEAAESFFETAEIKTIVSYLKVIDNPMRDIELLAVMLSPLFGFTPDDAALLRVKFGRKTSLFAGVLKACEEGDEKCVRLVGNLDYYKKLSACSSVDMLLREIYADTAYPYIAGAMSDGEVRKKNLYKLLEAAEKNCETYSSLGSFIRYLDMMRENSADMGEAGAVSGVRVMSMHKSKGLEFPFVFIAGTTKDFNKTDTRAGLVISHENGLGIKRKEPENLKLYHTLSSMAVKTETEANAMSEELRIYYVALTRAKQELHIVTACNKAQETLINTEYLLSNINGIPPYFVRNASRASKWLMACLLKHPDAAPIRFVSPDREKQRGDIKISYIPEVPEKPADEIDTEEAQPDEMIVTQIKEKAAFTYNWSTVSSALSKHTASSLHEEFFDPSGFGKSVPAFMFSSSLSPADIGTATHKFLQYCDFSVCRSCPDAERDRLIKEGRLTSKQAAVVDMESVRVFVSSDIMKRAEKSGSLYREKQFTMAKSICDIDKNISEKFRDEKTVVIGKIDLLFIENDGAVIVDYKTDNINDIGVLEDRYRSQMLLYIEAIEKSMEIKVKECILYSLKLKDSISLMF